MCNYRNRYLVLIPPISPSSNPGGKIKFRTKVFYIFQLIVKIRLKKIAFIAASLKHV